MSTSSSTNQFLDKRESGHYIDLSLRPLSNYLNFESSLSEGFILNPHKLLRSRVVCIDDRNVRICGFNSAWRSTGGYGDDLKRLVIGERVVDLALEQFRSADLKIAACTPPAGVVIRERSRSDRGSLIFQNFDLLLCGHIHEAKPNFSRGVFGNLIVSQCGALFSGRNYFNGYQLIDIDFDTLAVNCHILEWSNRVREFVPASSPTPLDWFHLYGSTFRVVDGCGSQGGSHPPALQGSCAKSGQ